MSDENDSAPGGAGGRKLFGRRRSHKLRGGRQTLMETRLPELAAWDPEHNAEDGGAIDLGALFGPVRDVWLEIGFGGGEHVVHLATTNPEVGLIACEHYLDGVAKLVSAVEREGLQRVRIHPHDARDVIDALPPTALGRVYLLYPDPWPKKRHHKRRFVNPETLDAMARAMRPGAELRIASDIPDYIRHCLAEALDHPSFEWTATGPKDWLSPWEEWPGTRYEAKALREGRTPAYLRFRRL